MRLDTEKIISDIESEGFSIQTKVLTEPEAEHLLHIFSDHVHLLKPAGIGKKEHYTHSDSIRKDEIVWVDGESDPALRTIFFSEIDRLMTELNRNFFLGLKSYEFHFARYEKGSFYRRHRDAFRNDDARRISVVLYLNRNWKSNDGGELIIYKENSSLVVQPECGTLVIFESNIEHEVLVSHTERISLTGWIKNRMELI